MAGKRCAHEGCRAWAMRGGDKCRAHEAPHALAQRALEAIDEAEQEARKAREAFRKGMERGKYGELLGRELAEIIEQAGRQGALIEEIGALRVVMKKLLAHQKGAERLSVSVPRVVNATVRALKAQRAISGETAADLTEALTRVLLEMGLGE